MKDQPTSMSYLSNIMAIQIIAFFAYGFVFFFVPTWSLMTLFGFESVPETFWIRGFGAVFIAAGFGEYLTRKELVTRLDLVWQYVLIPILIFIGFIWESVTGSYPGSNLFLWVNTVVTLFFALSVGITRVGVNNISKHNQPHPESY